MTEAMRTHTFTDRAGTTFVVEMPDHWLPSKSKALITLSDSANGTLLQITLMPALLADAIRKDLHKAVQVSADQALFRSAEPSIEIKAFQAGQALGYCYSAQDRKPKPGEWPFITSGLFVAGELVIHFTILSHRAPPEGTKEAIAAVAGMQIRSRRP